MGAMGDGGIPGGGGIADGMGGYSSYIIGLCGTGCGATGGVLL